MKRILGLMLWFPFTIFTLLISGFFLHYRINLLAQQEGFRVRLDRLPVDKSLPQVLGLTIDPDAEKVQAYLAAYNSPLKNSTLLLLQSARRWQVDPLIIVAIAQCETNLGKKSPPDCYNPFGLGIYADRKTCFSSWEESYEAMAKTLRKKYYDLGLVEPVEIMEKYCPVSVEQNDGHWAKCVQKFYDEIKNTAYNTKY